MLHSKGVGESCITQVAVVDHLYQENIHATGKMGLTHRRTQQLLHVLICSQLLPDHKSQSVAAVPQGCRGL